MAVLVKNKNQRFEYQENEVYSDEQSEFEVSLHKNNDLTKCMRQCKKNRKAVNNKFNWTLQENLKYASFLKQKRILFDCGIKERKSLKVNVLISKVVKTRTPAQCRSHHQKMMLHHRTIQNIIQHFEEKKYEEKSIDLKNEVSQNQVTKTYFDDQILQPFLDIETFMKINKNQIEVKMEEIVEPESIHIIDNLWWNGIALN